MSIAATPTRNGVVAVRTRRDDLLRKALPFVVLFLAAVGLRPFVVANTDVSWQITLSEKVLDGQRLYIDLMEVNPPASTFLYLPAVALARVLGLAPELVVNVLVFIGALVSLAIVSHIVRLYRLLDGLPGWPVATFALTVLTIIPAQTFGQREHIALIAVLPALALLVARAERARPLLWHCLVAGAGAGVTICIKPHFALAIGLAAAAVALHLRSWRVIFVLENWIAAAVAVGYGVCVVVFYRAYITQMMPLLADLYLPVRAPLVKLLANTPMVLWDCAVLVVLGLRRGTQPAFLVLLTASVGFAASYVIQGKGWPYHSYPMLALVLIALDLAGACCRRDAEQAGEGWGFERFGAVAVLGVVAACSFIWLNLAVDTRAAAAVVGRVAPPHPSIVIVSDDLAIGHPLVREVDGRWISSFPSLWITGNGAFVRTFNSLDEAAKQRVSSDVEAERLRLIGEIRDGTPDIILVDNRAERWSDWIDADRDLAVLIGTHYREIDTVDGVTILKRNGS